MAVVEIRPLVLFDNDPHQCDQCERSYKYKDSLTRHIRQAHSDAVFDCKICDKTYKSDNALRRHSKTHKEESQLQCKECDQKFVEKYRLVWHMAFDHRGEVMRCAHCYRGFRTVWGYKRHLKSAHTAKEGNVKKVDKYSTSWKVKITIYF